MRFFPSIAAIAFIAGVASAEADSELKIDVTRPVPAESCTRKTKKGDKIHVNYIGTLEDGSEFDRSRGSPLAFTLGVGQVIEGWDKGLLGMCIGENRTLHIPYQMAYGERGAGGVIPPKANLIFDTELVDIDHTKDEL